MEQGSITPTHRTFFERRQLSMAAVRQPILPFLLRCSNSGYSERRPSRLSPVGGTKRHIPDRRRDALRPPCRPERQISAGATCQKGGLPILIDAERTILDRVSDAGFMMRTEAVSPQPGGSWREASTGPGAIDTGPAPCRTVPRHRKRGLV